MIVYYNTDTYSILGMSYKVIPGRNELYFETDDPVAEKIFRGYEKISKYIAVPSVIRSSRGKLKLRVSNVHQGMSITDKIYKIPTQNEYPEVSLTYIVNERIIEIELFKDMLDWWKNTPNVNSRNMYFIIGDNDNPYMPLWVKAVIHSDFVDNKLTVDCTVNPAFNMFTVKLFDSYRYETKLSRN
tara:strand:- start:969 stop:1523 length:555 start_codon:yes stop_codon:yes gene_type:complete